MKIKKKILLLAIGPVLLLGIVSMALTLTMIRGSMLDEIQEAVALDTDLKTLANASAWSLEDDTAVEITDVKYDVDPETITPGIYDVTFATKGYEYKIDTTDKFSSVKRKVVTSLPAVVKAYNKIISMGTKTMINSQTTYG